jgi:protein-L-isoaspartate(D-aspartate) O-methyltransferase
MVQILRPPEFIRDGRTVPSPEVTHIMGEMLRLTPADKLLEIGTGSASQTAEWAKSGCEVHTIELQPVTEPWQVYLGKDQVYAHIGDGKRGLPQEAPFSAIVATCGIEAIPDAWKDQLKPSGRMVVPIGTSSCQRLTLFEKDEDGRFIPQRIAGYVRFSMMR